MKGIRRGPRGGPLAPGPRQVSCCQQRPGCILIGADRNNSVVTRHTLRLFLLACSSVFALSGCGSRRGSAQPDSTTVTIAVSGPENGMNPVDDRSMKFLVFLPLVAENERGELEGRLARSWQHSPDWREWTFHLRTDVRWEDGVAVTARDVEFTLALLANPDVGEFGPHTIEAVTVPDDSTLTVRYGDLDAINNLTWEVYFPKHLLQGLNPKEIASWKFWLQPVGDGPYRFRRHVSKTLTEFEAKPGYFRGKPRIERVILRFLDDAGSLAEFLGGGLDVRYGATPTQSRLLVKDPRFRVYQAIGSSVTAIVWNNQLPLFGDANVRRALTHAINRVELRDVLDFPPELPVLDGPYTLRQLTRGDLPTPLPYDTARSRALLEEAGWFDRNGDGIRERNGKPFHFTAVAYSSAGPVGYALAVYVQEQLRRVGIWMEIQTVAQGVPSKVQLDAVVSRVPEAPWSWTKRFGDSSSVGYRNPRVVQLLRQLPLAFNPDEEDRIRRELATIFQVDAPATFFFPEVNSVVVRRRVRGLSSPRRADPLKYMDELWLEDPR